MTREEVYAIGDDNVPRGYKVMKHELRGYDSPDRWFSAATVRGRKIGEFGSLAGAIEACQNDAREVRRRARRKAK